MHILFPDLFEIAMDDDEKNKFLKNEETDLKRRTSKRSTTEREQKDKDKKEHSKKARSSKEREAKEKKTMDKMKHEMEEMKKTIAELTKLTGQSETTKSKRNEIEYALGFDKNNYLEMGFINSAIWITNVVAVNMKERMKEDETRWEVLQQMKPSFTAGTPCATFNRGEPCNLGKWHSTPRKQNVKARLAEPFAPPIQRNAVIQSSREELRIHACTLCMKALGVASGHPVLDCPWILEKNWIKRGDQL